MELGSVTLKRIGFFVFQLNTQHTPSSAGLRMSESKSRSESLSVPGPLVPGPGPGAPDWGAEEEVLYKLKRSKLLRTQLEISL